MTLSNNDKIIKDRVTSIMASMQTIENEQEHIKDICKSLKEDFGLEPKHIKKVAKLKHSNNLTSYQNEQATIDDIINKVS